METSNTQYFALDDGVVELHKDKIVIHDKAKRNSLFETISTVCWMIYAIASIARGFKEDFDFSFYLGVLLLTVWLARIITRIVRGETTNSEFYLNDITMVAFKSSWMGEVKIGKIKTRQNKLRQLRLSTADYADIRFRNELSKVNIETSEK